MILPILLLASLSGIQSKAVPAVDVSAVSAATLLDRGLTALGGEDAIRSLQGVRFHSPKLETILSYLWDG